MGARATEPRRRNIAKIKTGIYTGNGANDRDIDIGVDLAAKNNPFVIIKGANGGGEGALRIEYGQGDLCNRFTNNAIADVIQSFTSTGFQIGTRPEVNAIGVTYHYIAFWEEP